MFKKNPTNLLSCYDIKLKATIKRMQPYHAIKYKALSCLLGFFLLLFFFFFHISFFRTVEGYLFWTVKLELS